MDLTWHRSGFADLPGSTLYAILALRSRVFVVEQRCVYNDIDGLDDRSEHLWAQDGARIVAYLRIVDAGAKYVERSIGRVVVAEDYRAHGLGKQLMQRGLAAVGAAPIRIQAQAHLERFYDELGFRRVSEPYVEDGIPHVDMLKPAAS
jgi:ElaA protein